MSLDYINVKDTDSLKDVSNQIKVHEKRTGRIPLVLVTKKDILTGYLPTYKLTLLSSSKKVKDNIHKVIKVKHNTSYKKIINIFKANPHEKVVVIGENKNAIGVVYSDDVLRLIEDNNALSLYSFAGVNKEEYVFDNAKTKVKYRYKWLFLNLFTAFIAAFTVSLFDNTLSKYVILASYMPIVAGMGGNSANQTLAVVVRGITLNQIKLENSWITLKKELKAALINGLLNGTLVFFIISILNKNILVGIILGLAMIINLQVAAFFGTLTPLIMKKLNKDPATSATIFITTATDVLGFLSFLGLASIILP